MKQGLLFFLIVYNLVAYSQKLRTEKLDFSSQKISVIFKKIGNKKIVGIGEGTHGTSEFYKFRLLLTKQLILKKKFNLFILENPHEDMIAIEKNLRDGNIDTLMRRYLFPIYQTQEMKEFLLWLKLLPKKIKPKLAGCDDSYREILPAMLKEECVKFNSKELDSLVKDFEKRQILDAQEYYMEYANQKLAPNEYQYGYDTYQTLKKIDSIVRINNYENENLKELIFQALTNYTVYDGLTKLHKLISRDSIMGERVNYYTRNPHNKIIVWAHDGHIAKQSFDGEIGKMGETINNANPDNYYSIGQIATSGTYSYINSRFINDDHIYNDTLHFENILPLHNNTWNKRLANASRNNFMIDFNSINKLEREYSKNIFILSFLGYRKQSVSNISFSTQIFGKFDLLLVFKETHHTTPIAANLNAK